MGRNQCKKRAKVIIQENWRKRRKKKDGEGIRHWKN